MQVLRNWDGAVIHETHQNRPRARPRARKAGLGWRSLGVLRQVRIAAA